MRTKQLLKCKITLPAKTCSSFAIKMLSNIDLNTETNWSLHIGNVSCDSLFLTHKEMHAGVI